MWQRMFQNLRLPKRQNNPGSHLLACLDKSRVPRHVAVIMDGNGRWATQKGFPRIYGHRAGMETVRRVIEIASDIGIEVLTLYVFSTENWRRPSEEVEFLMSLPGEYLVREIDNLMKNGVRIYAIGDLDGLPANAAKAIRDAMETTAQNKGLIVNLAINYGGRAEIVGAAKKLAEKVRQGEISPEDITEETFATALLTADFPDPELVIRPSGELRLSNFLLWQAAYSELWFSEVYWPDFSKEDFLRAILDFQKRERRFGGINK